MAVSASISNRCGLTARIVAASAMTRLKSTSDGLRMAGGGMAVLVSWYVASGSGNHLGNLTQLGQQRVGAVGGVLELVRRGFQGGPVAGVVRRLHPQPFGCVDVPCQSR